MLGAQVAVVPVELDEDPEGAWLDVVGVRREGEERGGQEGDKGHGRWVGVRVGGRRDGDAEGMGRRRQAASTEQQTLKQS